MPERESELLSNAQAQRVRASRLLLVALVKEHELPVNDSASRLARWMSRIRQARPAFFFDLGWQEDLETGYEALANLNWVSAHESTPTYRATDVGIAHLEDHRDDIENAIGVRLDELDGMSHGRIEAKGVDSDFTHHSGEVTLLATPSEWYVTIEPRCHRPHARILVQPATLAAACGTVVDHEISRIYAGTALNSSRCDIDPANVGADCMDELVVSARRFRADVDQRGAAHAVSSAAPLPP